MLLITRTILYNQRVDGAMDSVIVKRVYEIEHEVRVPPTHETSLTISMNPDPQNMPDATVILIKENAPTRAASYFPQVSMFPPPKEEE